MRIASHCIENTSCYRSHLDFLWINMQSVYNGCTVFRWDRLYSKLLFTARRATAFLWASIVSKILTILRGINVSRVAQLDAKNILVLTHRQKGSPSWLTIEVYCGKNIISEEKISAIYKKVILGRHSDQKVYFFQSW